ncbi:hypothetical protein LCGC14_1217130, partial [marine sediment metagenome]
VPTGAEPWFVLASTADDNPDSGLTLSATNDLGTAISGTVVAYKVNGVWRNPVALSIQANEDKFVADAGRDRGFEVRPTLSGGNVATWEVAQGEVVDPDGIRRLIQGATAPLDAESITPVLPHESLNRTDFLVLRQRENFTGELAYLMGMAVSDKNATIDESTITLTASGANERPHYFARRGGTDNEQWWAWGNSTSLYYQGGPTGSGGGGFGPSLFVASGTVTDVQIVGQREADGAVLIMYIAGGNTLTLVAINKATGAVIDAVVTINTVTNDITHCRGVLDHNEELHVVFQHDENASGLDEQVYYTRRTTVTGATFGDSSISPRFVDGSNSGVSDTGPDIDVDRKGIAHIVYITGTGGSSNTWGELRYSTIDQGATTFQKTYSNTGDTGKDPGLATSLSSLPIAIYSDGGTTIENVRFASITVTPHDEVNAIVVGKDSGDAAPEEVFLFNPDFESRLGFALIEVNAAGAEVKEASIASDEQGGLYLAGVVDGGATDSPVFYRIDTVFAPNGRVLDSMLSVGKSSAQTWTTFAGEIFLEVGHSGEMVFLFEDTGVSAKSTAMALNSSGVTGAFAATPNPHPKDVYLASWDVRGEATPVLPESEVNLVNIRPRKLNYPFLVGDNGDFHGYNALFDAVRAGNRSGGEIVVRSGHHRLNNRFELRTPIRIYGEGLTVLEWESAAQDGFLVASGSSVAVGSISGQVLTLTTTVVGRTSPGDLVKMATSGFHRVVRVINDKVVVDGDPPVGGTVIIYPAGAVFENLTFMTAGDSTSSYPINIFRGSKVRVSNCAFRANPGTVVVDAVAVLLDRSRDCLVENCDFSEWSGAATGFGIRMEAGFHNKVDGCLFESTSAKLKVLTTEFEPRISNCSSLAGLGAGLIYEIDTTRTDPVHMVNCVGGVTPAADLDGSVTFVGESIHAATTLAFSDANTAGASEAKPVPFSDPAAAVGDWLPDSGHAFPINSILHGQYSYLSNQANHIGEGIYSGPPVRPETPTTSSTWAQTERSLGQPRLLQTTAPPVPWSRTLAQTLPRMPGRRSWTCGSFQIAQPTRARSS